MRQANRRDENELLIMGIFRAAGWSVQQLNDGGGVPDLIVGRGVLTALVEVVGSAKLRKYREANGISPVQFSWHRSWKGAVHIVRTLEEAGKLCEEMGKLSEQLTERRKR